jgi:hypothetical protein
MHAEQFSTPHLARLISGITAKETVMPDRRRVVAKAIIAAGAYLHPNFYVGDQDKKLWQIQSDAPITDIPGELDVGEAPVIGGRARKLNF